MPSDVLQFGQQVDGVEYRDRPGAYGLIVKDQQIAITRVRNKLYLPGGGIEDGETPEQALHREVLEETGWQIQIEAMVGESRQFIRSDLYNAYFNKLQSFYTARALQVVTAGIEPDHELVWLSFEEAASGLVEDSDTWAVKSFLL